MKERLIPVLGRGVGEIGYGAMGISWGYTTIEDSDVQGGIDVIRYGIERGISFIDTADFYGKGHNEEVVGQAIAPFRDDIVLATKVGLIREMVEQPDGSHKPETLRSANPQYVRQAVDASLRRLNIDVIDLYYLHRVDPHVPLEDTWGAMSELVAKGKVRALGLSEVSITQAEQAHAIHPVAAIQSEYSLWTRDIEGTGVTADGDPAGNLLRWTQDHGAVIVPFSPLGRGFLTGGFDKSKVPNSDVRIQMSKFSDANMTTNQKIVEAVKRIAHEHNVPPSAISLAWVLAQGENVIPIPGTTKTANLDSNLTACDVQLSAEDLALLDSFEVRGDRY